jgi:ferredoxin
LPRLTVDGKTSDAPAGRRLVLAIEDTGVKIGHRCGGQARCTTCRVEFEQGEPDTMTEAEYAKLKERDLFGKVRLSCQIICDHDMTVRPQVTLEREPTWTDTGPPPAETVEPKAEWFRTSDLEQQGRLQA